MKFSEQRLLHHSKKTARNYLLSFLGTQNYLWAIEEKNSGNLLGTISAYVDTKRKWADLGILVGNSKCSQGVGTQAWLIACEYLFRFKKIKKITGGTNSLNKPMIRVFEKTGMYKDNIKQKKTRWRGKLVPVFFYSITRNNWLTQRSRLSAQAINYNVPKK